MCNQVESLLALLIILLGLAVETAGRRRRNYIIPATSG